MTIAINDIRPFKFVHRIFPADWQLAKTKTDEGLTAIVLPLVDGHFLPDDLSDCKVSPSGNVFCDRPGWDCDWRFHIPWQVSDRICFTEPWVYSNKRKKAQARSWFHEDADEFAQWQPPQFMPEEAARFWFEVTAIGVEKLGRICVGVLDGAGLHQRERINEIIDRWNDANPGYPYNRDSWAIVLHVKSVEFVEEE